MVAAAAAARAERRAKLKAAHEGAPHITEQQRVDDALAGGERGGDAGSPS